MKLQIVALSKFAAPRIVDDHGCAELGRLHKCLNFAAILSPLSTSFGEEEIDGALLVAVATLEESVTAKDGLKALFCLLTFEEFLPDGFGHEHD